MHNKVLADARGISKDDRIKIDELHDKLYDITDNPDYCENPVELIESLEHDLQKLWKFPQDRNYHSWWTAISGCLCPRIDNLDAIGTEHRVVNLDCKWHNSSI